MLSFCYRYVCAVVLMGAVLAVSSAWAQGVAIPQLTSPVYDATSTLTSAETADLTREVRRFEDSTSNQIAIVIVPTLGDADIREFAIDLLKKNQIGQKGRDNGILLLVVKADRKVSIEVGYGLEGVLPDAVSNQIIRNEILPRFKKDLYFQGIVAAVLSIEQATRGEYKGTGKKSGNGSGTFAVMLVLFVVGTVLMSLFRNGRRYAINGHGYRSSSWWGGGFGGGGFGGGGFGGGGGGWSAGGGSFGGGGSSGSW